MKASGGKATPFSSGFIGQVVAGLRLAVTGKTPDWFGPGVPLAPVAPAGVAGRRNDYPVGANLNTVPKTEANQGVSFDQLRNLADSHDVLRLVIETRKDQMAKMKWSIKAKEGKTASDASIQAMADLFAFPDGQNDFHTWLRLLLEDLFVLDAPALYVKRTKGNKPIGFEPVDGATIKRLIDESGRTPELPSPAYQQILKGLPAADLTTDDLVYMPRNIRNHMIYGYGPVEQIIVTVNIGIRRMLGQLVHFTDGSVPAAICSTPETWTAEQIEQFQDYWDSILSGNEAQKSRVRFVPSGANFSPLKPELLSDKFDEWLSRIICYAFSVSNQPFVTAINRATAESAHQQSLQEGLAPVMLWVKTLVDRLLRQYLGITDLEFSWAEEEEVDPLVQAQIDQILANTGILTIDEIREKRGLEPLPEPVVETPALPLSAPFDPAMSAPAHPGLATIAPGPAPVAGVDSKPGKAAPAPVKPAEKLAKGKVTAKAPKANPAHEKAFRAAVKKWARGQVPKVAAQITAGLGKVDKADGDRAGKIVQGVDLNTGALAKQLKPILEDIYQEAAADAAEALSDELPAYLQVVSEEGVKWAEEHVGDLVKGIDDSTKTMIREAVVQTLNEGLSTSQLADLLTDGYAFSDARAETIARTESAHALVSGTLESWQQSGVVDHAEFDASPDCCDECLAEDGTEIPFGTNPEDFMHPNCRCGVTAVLSTNNESSTPEEGE